MEINISETKAKSASQADNKSGCFSGPDHKQGAAEDKKPFLSEMANIAQKDHDQKCGPLGHLRGHHTEHHSEHHHGHHPQFPPFCHRGHHCGNVIYVIQGNAQPASSKKSVCAELLKELLDSIGDEDEKEKDDWTQEAGQVSSKTDKPSM